MVSKRLIVRQARDILLFIMAGTAMTWFTCSSCRTSLVSYSLVAAFSSLHWIFIWKGNSLLAHYLDTVIPWVDLPVRRMIVGIVVSISYTVAAVVGILALFEYIFGLRFGSYEYTIYSAVAITIVISLVLHSRTFFLHWRQAKVDAERFEKESILARYESLKNQVNPHFLFNSLNALTNLVYTDQDKAVRFIKQLSEVYRYVLDTREREVVPLEEELKFMRSYSFLEQIRFGDKLRIEIKLDGVEGGVAPLSLQMLLENCIKHNIISEENPLQVKIYTDEHYIVVENNLQPKDRVAEKSGVGLENIEKRYGFLTDRKVEIVNGQHVFIVKLPLIPYE